MPKFTHHIFVCSNRREPGHRRGCCDSKGTDELRSALKAEIKKRGLKSLVRANSAGCLDQCELGPVLVIYPQAIWYGRVQLSDVRRIVERTIEQGEILEDLLLTDDQLNLSK
jgi:(2Fe-2S) ferredoxin